MLSVAEVDTARANRLLYQIKFQLETDYDGNKLASISFIGTRVLLKAGFAALVVFAAIFVWWVGHRGLFIFDHGVVFDGGYRVYLGQVPYKDIYMAYLPGALWVQAFFIWLCGVDFSAMVVPACVFNSIATAAVMRITWLLFPGRVLACLSGGLLTALWFQAPYGGLLHEDVAFTCNVIAMWLLFEAAGARPSDQLVRFLVGVLLLFAVLCKQNAGGLFLPVPFLIVFLQLVPDWKGLIRSWLAIAAGFMLAVAAFGFWTWRYSNFQAMRVYALETPMQLARARLLQNLGNSVLTVTGFMAPLAIAIFIPAFVALAFLVVLFAFFGKFPDDTRRRAQRIAPLLSAALLGYEQTFQLTALNESENAVPFIGLAFGLMIAAVGELFFDRMVEFRATGSNFDTTMVIPSRAVNRLLCVLGITCFLLVAVEGVRTDVRRIVHFPRGTRFLSKLDIRRASRVYWAEPNIIDNKLLKKSEFEAVVHFLEQHEGNFFTFPDAIILYGMVGRTPPQPILFFVEGHSYRHQDIPQLDRQILASLEKNRVRYFVLEKAGFMTEPGAIRMFPLVWNWLQTNFRPVAHFGFFDVWEKGKGHETATEGVTFLGRPPENHLSVANYKTGLNSGAF